MSSRFTLGLALTLAVGILSTASAVAEDSIPRLVYLISEGDRLIASNIQFSRFDALRLQAKEKIEQQKVAKAVIVVVTNQRIIGYSVYQSAWRVVPRDAGETVVSVDAEDYSASVITSDRMLNFNGRSGAWVEMKR